MTIRAVDVVNMLPKLSEGPRVQRDAGQQAVVVHHAAAQQGQARVEVQRNQVQHTTETEKQTIRRDGQGTGQGGANPGRQYQKRTPAKEPAAADGSPVRGGLLDIRI